MPTTYRLDRSPLPPSPPLVPDAAQQRVLDHQGGPLLVLAGPGTGKTTTIVELVARRIEAGLSAEAVLVLTFSRRAAGELRERIGARVGGGRAAPTAWTFHAFCYALARAHQEPEAYAHPLRLLSAPEQDVALRELLRGTIELGTPVWPDRLRPALPTRGFADEVRGLMARARDVGLEPPDLADLARREGRADWAALAQFYEEYLQVLDLQGVADYSGLVTMAANLVHEPVAQQELRERYQLVVVDEYQDTDPAQERLLRGLAGDGRDLVVVGDPDQAVYGFRGADVEGLLTFPQRFRRSDGTDAPTEALTVCRRSAGEIVAVSRKVVGRVPLVRLPAAKILAHRQLSSAPGAPEGEVAVRTYPSPGAQAEAIAELLRREHLESGTDWSRMAVLVRSAARSVPHLRRVLAAAGVPVEVAADELPLAHEPAVAPLLLALRIADHPALLTQEYARTLLLSPLGGADPAALRRLGRALRAADAAGGKLPRPSAELLAEALSDPGALLDRLPGTAPSTAVHRLGELLARAHALLHPDSRRVLPAHRSATGSTHGAARGRGTPEDALWLLWSGSSWPRRLERASAAGGFGGRAADRDLDAVVALFAAVGRATDRRDQVAGVGPMLDELEAQQIPADTLAEHGLRGSSVRLLTAHRSKGLEWDVVVVADVQDGIWPDLRRRSSLLETERLPGPADGAGLREPDTREGLLADERRLFYVALTRARRRLWVTAVDAVDDEGERPSQFLEELGEPVEAVTERVARPLSLPGLVAALRRYAVDPDVSAAMRAAAAERLALLAAQRDPAGDRLVPAAHPGSWWGVLPDTVNARSVRDPQLPVPLSASSLTSIERCPLKWFYEHEAHAELPTATYFGFGRVIHALAEEVASGRTPPDEPALVARLDVVWHQLGFETSWQGDQQREQAREALRRFLAWHNGSRGRTLVGAEARFSCEIRTEQGVAMLRGSIDRLELDADGRVQIVDLKTGRTKPSDRSMPREPQLATYQLAVDEGALDEALGGHREVAGAELLQLRYDPAKFDVGAKTQRQPPLAEDPEGDPEWIRTQIGMTVGLVLAEEFTPRPGPRCDTCPYQRACPAVSEGEQVVR